MDTFIVDGGNPLNGTIQVSGAKNVALKATLASLLTDEELILHNIPAIRDVKHILEMLTAMGVAVHQKDHTVRLKNGNVTDTTVPLEVGARSRTSSMVIGPLLARYGRAKIPNPGGCRLGARPIDRHIEGLRLMGADIGYYSEDGFYHAKAKKLHGATITFPKNTHTGTETLILAAVLADGQTVLRNAAAEVEVDDLIALLGAMGAKVTRTAGREIVIDGVERLHGAEYTLMPDRNEEVTFAIGALVTGGDVAIRGSQPKHLTAFLDALKKAGASYKQEDENVTRYSISGPPKSTDITTTPYPGFMTDWQAPWALLMTQAAGTSTIHETVFESRFAYVRELWKMGAKIDYFDPVVASPEKFYNFNWSDHLAGSHQGIRIEGPKKLHNAILEIDDLRAGATLLLAALTAEGRSSIHGVRHIDRGYETIEERLRKLGAAIQRQTDD